MDGSEFGQHVKTERLVAAIALMIFGGCVAIGSYLIWEWFQMHVEVVWK